LKEEKLENNAKMGKRSRQIGANLESASNAITNSHSKNSILSDEKAVDPSLALLFASSVSSPSKQFISSSNYI
jgi:hypothetical protein